MIRLVVQHGTFGVHVMTRNQGLGDSLGSGAKSEGSDSQEGQEKDNKRSSEARLGEVRFPFAVSFSSTEQHVKEYSTRMW